MNASDTDRADTVSPQTVMDLAWGLQKSMILHTAFELGVFTALGDETRTSEQVARSLGTDKRATDRLMNALCAMELMEKENGQFSNAPVARRFLVKGKPEYMKAITHIANIWEPWRTLAEAVRVGKRVAGWPTGDQGRKHVEAFIAAMHWFAGLRANHVIDLIDLSGVSRVLDVGGGSGAYSMAFVRKKKGVTAQVFELPNVIPLTEKYIREANLAGKIETVVGDYNTDELGSGFDLVFLSAIVHSNSFDQNEMLIRKAVSALNPGGQVVVQDFVMDEDRTSPAFGAIFALNMLVNTEAGDTYTEREIRSWMESAGLSDIVRKDTTVGSSLIIGWTSE